MRYLFSLLMLSVLFVGCLPPSTVQVPDIKQPVTLSTIIGPDKTVLPSSAKSLHQIHGVWLDLMTSSSGGGYTTTTTAQQNSVQSSIAQAIGEDPQKCVVNFTFDLTSWFTISGYKNKFEVSGDAYDLKGSGK